jgi:hypothetical protein
MADYRTIRTRWPGNSSTKLLPDTFAFDRHTAACDASRIDIAAMDRNTAFQRMLLKFAAKE